MEFYDESKGNDFQLSTCYLDDDTGILMKTRSVEIRYTLSCIDDYGERMWRPLEEKEFKSLIEILEISANK
jgi:hypothetical protein